MGHTIQVAGINGAYNDRTVLGIVFLHYNLCIYFGFRICLY